jgi:hypothetical protein
LTGFSEVALLGSYPSAERGGPFGKVSYPCGKRAIGGESHDG